MSDSILSNVSDGFKKATTNIADAVPQLTPNSSNVPGSAGFKDFMESNNLVAKIAFLLLVVFIFIVILQLSIRLLTFYFDTSTSPYLINGMVKGNQPIIFPQDPSSLNSKSLQRSINGPDGIEFTWSVWVYIETLPNTIKYSHIFSKGNSDIAPVDQKCTDSTQSCFVTGLVQPSNAPGLYIAPGTNELVVVMNTFNTINNEITIPNIPLNKWINTIIRCHGTTIDVYINGTIAKSIDLGYVPKQNYGDVYVALNSGFDGNISNLRYYNYALGTSEIQSITQVGPNIAMVDNTPGSGMSSKYSKYFSLSWYFAGNETNF